MSKRKVYDNEYKIQAIKLADYDDLKRSTIEATFLAIVVGS